MSFILQTRCQWDRIPTFKRPLYDFVIPTVSGIRVMQHGVTQGGALPGDNKEYFETLIAFINSLFVAFVHLYYKQNQ